jgi:hypothetical protein
MSASREATTTSVAGTAGALPTRDRVLPHQYRGSDLEGSDHDGPASPS